MEIKDKIKNLIQEALEGLSIKTKEISIEHPASLKMGDYSTNVAMVLAKKNGKNPKELAEKITSSMSRPDLDMEIREIQVAEAGFINFFLSRDFFVCLSV